MVDALTKNKLKSLIRENNWEAIYNFVADVTSKWHDEEYKEEDQFNTMWNMARKQGKIDGLKEFFEDLERLTLDDNK